tara:strand:- start:187 stop:543 length:357 start_codon:yes stop_codon:yes gene_type:complete
MDQLKIITLSFAIVFLINTNPLAVDRHNILIDVRTEKEFHKSHIPGAINVPLNIIHTRIEKIVNNTNENITLYCRSGRRSELARNILTKLGYSNVTNGGSMTKVAESYSRSETDNNNH